MGDIIFLTTKAAGEDGIFPAIHQNGVDLIIDIVYKLFIASIRLQHIPIIWRGVRVVFLPKLGQISYLIAKAFRPISLTSFMLKTLEKLIDRDLRDRILKTYELHYKQYAYQPKKSAEVALHHLIARIEKALEYKQFALGCLERSTT